MPTPTTERRTWSSPAGAFPPSPSVALPTGPSAVYRRQAQSRLVLLLLFHTDSVLSTGLVARAPDPFDAGLFRLSIMSDQPQTAADIAARYRDNDDMLRITAWLRAGRWEAIRSAAAGFPPTVRSQVRSKALAWAGAFGLDHEQASLIQEGPVDVAVPDYWKPCSSRNPGASSAPR